MKVFLLIAIVLAQVISSQLALPPAISCPPEPCPVGKVWNSYKCKCVCQKSISTVCNRDLYYFDQNTCNCECRTKLKCKSYQYFDKSTCTCKCTEPCQVCSLPQLWSYKTCGCKCKQKDYELRKTCIKGLQYWDEQECKCSCRHKPTECCPNKEWDDDTCGCECNAYCYCPEGQSWNTKTCECECDPKPNCPAGYYLDPLSCRCLCEASKYSKCGYGFDHNECRCKTQEEECTGTCENEYVSWDNNFCECPAEYSFGCVSRKPPSFTLPEEEVLDPEFIPPPA